MSKPPTPAAKTAWLPSNGFDGLKATPHRFLYAREASIPSLIDGTWEDVWQFVYQCEETKAERVWGYVSKAWTDTPPTRGN